VLVLAVAIGVALLIPLVTRGSYARLLATRWYWGPLLFAGLAIQLVLEYVPPPRARWDDLGLALVLTSYALILAFCGRNLVRRGMGIVMIGVACNALAIAVNQGMPVKILPEWNDRAIAEPTVKHQPQEPDDKLIFLTDIIVLDSVGTVLSFGDLILAVGLCDVAYHASRRRRARRGTTIDLAATERAEQQLHLEPDGFATNGAPLEPGVPPVPTFATSASGSDDRNRVRNDRDRRGIAQDPFKGTDDAWVVDIRGS
jgi:hypothetical protein